MSSKEFVSFFLFSFFFFCPSLKVDRENFLQKMIRRSISLISVKMKVTCPKYIF